MFRHLSLTLAITLIAGIAGVTATYSAVIRPSHPLPVKPLTQPNCLAWPGGTGSLTDGDFSETLDPPGPSGVLDALRKGTVFAPDWVVTGHNTVDFSGSNNPYWQAPYNVCNVDLDGTPGPGGIEHRGIATAIGRQYTVTFEFSANGFCAPTVKTMTVSVGGKQSERLTWDASNGNDAEHGVWMPESWQFTAVHKKSKLRFKSNDPVGNCGPLVAAVSVTQD
jgi:Protein of unknown function (DUF642)